MRPDFTPLLPTRRGGGARDARARPRAGTTTRRVRPSAGRSRPRPLPRRPGRSPGPGGGLRAPRSTARARTGAGAMLAYATLTPESRPPRLFQARGDGEQRHALGVYLRDLVEAERAGIAGARKLDSSDDLPRTIAAPSQELFHGDVPRRVATLHGDSGVERKEGGAQVAIGWRCEQVAPERRLRTHRGAADRAGGRVEKGELPVREDSRHGDAPPRGEPATPRRGPRRARGSRQRTRVEKSASPSLRARTSRVPPPRKRAAGARVSRVAASRNAWQVSSATVNSSSGFVAQRGYRRSFGARHGSGSRIPGCEL